MDVKITRKLQSTEQSLVIFVVAVPTGVDITYLAAQEKSIHLL